MEEKVLNTYTAVILKDGDFYVAYAEELPGANTQGRTIEEAKENLKEAIQLVTDANKELSRKIIKR
jgi:predicted RNase H-like HicB family nuclease